MKKYKSLKCKNCNDDFISELYSSKKVCSECYILPVKKIFILKRLYSFLFKNVRERFYLLFGDYCHRLSLYLYSRHVKHKENRVEKQSNDFILKYKKLKLVI